MCHALALGTTNFESKGTGVVCVFIGKRRQEHETLVEFLYGGSLAQIGRRLERCGGNVLNDRRRPDK